MEISDCTKQIVSEMSHYDTIGDKMEEDKKGYVYILKSPNCECIKIGGTDYPPLKRIKEINATEPYKSLGPWTLSDFRQVIDWRKVEYNLHYKFRSSLNTKVEQQKELFYLSIKEASSALDELNENEIVYKPKIDRMFQDESFLDYLVKLFSFSGLNHWLDIQGIWTLVLFPSTNGGRYFTINIGPHEVAYSTLPKKCKRQENLILVDKLILDYKDIISWIKERNGKIELDHYKTALPRASSLIFDGTFQDVLVLLSMDGVRRALIAYWNEALIQMAENNKMSVYERFHNYNAVAGIVNKMKNI